MQHATTAVAHLHCHVRTWQKLKDLVWAYACLRVFMTWCRKEFGKDHLCYEQYVHAIENGLDKTKEDVLKALRQVQSLEHDMHQGVPRLVSN